MHTIRPRCLLLSAVLWGTGACSRDVDVGADLGGTSGSTGSSDSTSTTSTDATTGTKDPDSGGSASDGGPKFDLGTSDTGPGPATCEVTDDMNAIPPCGESAPPDSFDPVVQWSWAGVGTMTESATTPIVANLTDDDDSGTIDLCDTPDVVVVAYDKTTDYGPGIEWIEKARIFVLDGATGAIHFEIDHDVSAIVTPAVGDIDGDGLPEIVTAEHGFDSDLQVHRTRLVAFEHDGSLLWTSPTDQLYWCDPALADVDNDGDAEILCRQLYDHEGNALWAGVDNAVWDRVLADLDGDGDLEAIGRDARHHDGTPYYAFVHPDASSGYVEIAVADLDADPEPELIVGYTRDFQTGGIAILEHDGNVKTDVPDLLTTFEPRPMAVHDLDGDEMPELLVADIDLYRVLTPTLGEVWTRPVSEPSCCAGSTAFDFLSDNSADAIYADEHDLLVWNGADGLLQMQVSRSSWTNYEYPVVADVDADGSAEIVVVSSAVGGQQTAPMVQVVRDAEDRWVGSRRIWNQHAYHVTNVREDGTIPQFQPPHWSLLNTFRTQAQLENGVVCNPPAG